MDADLPIAADIWEDQRRELERGFEDSARIFAADFAERDRLFEENRARLEEEFADTDQFFSAYR